MSSDISHKGSSEAATALWVINHHAEEDGSNSLDKNDNIREPIVGCEISQVDQSQNLAEQSADATEQADGKVKASTETKPADDVNTQECPIPAQPTNIKLQIKHAKQFTLRKFDSRASMVSSQESLDSYNSNSVSMVSSFVSLRPKLPEVIALDRSFPGTNLHSDGVERRCERQASLRTPTYDPTFTDLASKIHETLEMARRLPTAPAQQRAKPEDYSGSSTEHDTSTSDEGLERDEPDAELRNRADVNAQSARLAARLAASRRNRKPQLNPVADIIQQQHDKALETTGELVPSDESLVDSACDTTPLAGEISGLTSSTTLNEKGGNGRSESFKHPPTPKHKASNRQHKSEPFPSGSEAPFAIVDGFVPAAKSHPVISESRAPPMEPVVEVAGPNNADEINKANKRKAIVEEIVSSEEKYVNILDQISKAVQRSREESVLDESSVYQIFHNIRLTDIAVHHSILLHSLQQLLRTAWHPEKSSIGSTMFDTFHRETLHDNYLSYVKNTEASKELIKQQLARNSNFVKLNERFKNENTSGHDLNAALSTPANRLSSYKMLLERYLENTPESHPDRDLVPKALRVIISLLDRVGKVDRKAKLTTLQELQKVLDVSELVSPEREFLRVDTVKVPGQTQDYSIWMFSDLLLLTINNTKIRSSRKISIVVHGIHGQDIVPGHRRYYKLYKRLGLDDIEVINSPESEVKRYQRDYDEMSTDLRLLRDIESKVNQLHTSHAYLSSNLDDLIERCERNLQSIKARQDSTDMASLRLNLQSAGLQMKVIFKDQKTRSMWERDLLQAKLNLEAVNTNKLPPQFVSRIPVDVTRAGMQLTCAAVSHASVGSPDRSVFVCNADASSAHVCCLSVSPKASALSNLTPLVCSSRINCVCSSPPYSLAISPVMERRISHSPADIDTREALMWFGCEDGKLFILPVSTTGTTPPLSLKFAHAITHMVHLEGKMFISISNGRLLIYKRESDGTWNTDTPHSVQLNRPSSQLKIIPASCKLWCASGNEITVIDPILEQAERSIKIPGDGAVKVQDLTYSRQGIVAVALHNSCQIKLFHSVTLRQLHELNIYTTVAQKLNKADEIIKQHKTACLRVTTLRCCKDLLWIGTTAGIILTCRLPKLLGNTCTRGEFEMPPMELTALEVGHTGNVRFITSVELPANQSQQQKRQSVARHSLLTKSLIISGGDGYEVVEGSAMEGDGVGFNDSINHLLAWTV